MPGIGGLSIANNLLANSVSLNLNRNQAALGTAVTDLSSGLRINTAADDPSGLAIAESLQAQVNGFDQGAQNVQDATNAAQVAEGALQTTTDILQRIRTLAVEGASDITSTDDRSQPAGRSPAAAARSQPHLAEHELQRPEPARRLARGLPAADGRQRDHHVELGPRRRRHARRRDAGLVRRERRIRRRRHDRSAGRAAHVHDPGPHRVVLRQRGQLGRHDGAERQQHGLRGCGLDRQRHDRLRHGRHARRRHDVLREGQPVRRGGVQPERSGVQLPVGRVGRRDDPGRLHRHLDLVAAHRERQPDRTVRRCRHVPRRLARVGRLDRPDRQRPADGARAAFAARRDDRPPPGRPEQRQRRVGQPDRRRSPRSATWTSGRRPPSTRSSRSWCRSVRRCSPRRTRTRSRSSASSAKDPRVFGEGKELASAGSFSFLGPLRPIF